MLLTANLGKRVYLDTNIFIYALEGYSEFVEYLTALFESIEAGKLTAVSSELTLAEALVKPFADGNVEAQTAYQHNLQTSDAIEFVPIHRDVLIQAAILKSVAPIRFPDAIHGATAILSNCDTFLTNDPRLLALPNLNVVILSNVVKKKPVLSLV